MYETAACSSLVFCNATMSSDNQLAHSQLFAIRTYRLDYMNYAICED